MFNRNGRTAARQRRLAVLAGAAFGILAIGFSATAEAPARAEEHAPRTVFAEAGTPFELAEVKAAPDGEAARAVRPMSEAPAVAAGENTEGRAIGGGVASFYGAELKGRPTASGERFNPAALTAAHRTLPFGTRLRVTNPRNGRSVVVRLNDRGPFHTSRVIDLSQEAARQIGLFQQGSGVVRLAALTS